MLADGSHSPLRAAAESAAAGGGVSAVEFATALQVLRLCESLEDDEDVQNVYSNVEISDELLARCRPNKAEFRLCLTCVARPGRALSL